MSFSWCLSVELVFCGVTENTVGASLKKCDVREEDAIGADWKGGGETCAQPWKQGQ